MREIYYGSRFRKDFRLAINRGLDMSLIREVMENLENEIPLDKKYMNHALVSCYFNYPQPQAASLLGSAIDQL